VDADWAKADVAARQVAPNMHFNIQTAVRYSQLAVFCLTIILFPGCCASDNSRTKIEFWAVGSEVEKIGELLDDFRRENPDVDVRIQQIPWSAAHEKLLTAFAGDATPDVCQLGNTWIPEFATLGALEPLDRYIERSKSVDKEDYFAGLWKTNELDSHVYGIPWYADTRLLFYRKDLLAKAGWNSPPRTWSEWLATMRDLKKLNPKQYAILMPTNEWEHLSILGMQAGSQLLRDDGRYANFDTPEFRKAFEFYASLYDEGLAPVVTKEQSANYWEEFARGHFAMYITGPWNIGEFRLRLPPELQDKWATAPFPRPDDAKFGVSQAGGSGLAMFKRSKNKEAAWRLVEFLARPEQLVRFYQLTGNLPPRESAWRLGKIASDPPVSAFHEQLEHVVPLPRVPEWEMIATTQIARAVQAVVAHEQTVDQAIADLDRRVNDVLEKRRWLLARHDSRQN
jgi:multiple sugar transport system substrate-binding protein